MRKPAIGILAGMGPRSTAPFVDMVVDECQRQYGARDDMDFPAMMIYSLPTPFYPGRPVDHDAMRAVILAGLRDLAVTGVDFVAMPCNTAHIYYEELQGSVDIPLLNIVDETLCSLPTACNRVALFATGATMDAGIYQRGLAKAGKELVFEPAWQGSVDGLLRQIKAGGQTVGSTAAMAQLLAEAARAGAECAVIGCTDLTPAALACGSALMIVDSARCLARAAVVRYVKLTKGAGQ